MLSSRLISILLSVSFSGVMSGCSLYKNKKSLGYMAEQPELNCKSSADNLELKHLVMASKTDETFKSCIKNYFQHEKSPQLNFSFCTKFHVKKNGKVTSVKIEQSNLPKSLSWCIEQQLWSRNFSGLQLQKDVWLSFPTKLQIKNTAIKN